MLCVYVSGNDVHVCVWSQHVSVSVSVCMPILMYVLYYVRVAWYGVVWCCVLCFAVVWFGLVWLGQVQPAFGQTTCLSCQKGQAPDEKRVQCIPCPPGNIT